jgi:hypothetical protein
MFPGTHLNRSDSLQSDLCCLPSAVTYFVIFICRTQLHCGADAVLCRLSMWVAQQSGQLVNIETEACGSL